MSQNITEKISEKENLDDYFADPVTFGTFDKTKDADKLDRSHPDESPLESPRKSLTVEEVKENDKVHMWQMMSFCQEKGVNKSALKFVEPDYFINNVHTEKESSYLVKQE